jgi:hypothetical protein
MPFRIVHWISLLSTGVTLTALGAHVLELPNKLALKGPLWLEVQQNLYRGWGPIIGPFEVTAIIASWILLHLTGKGRPIFGLTMIASCFLTGALAVFFILNAPVNAAFASWTPATLPSDWSGYRLRWELGHATSYVLVLIAFVALLRALFLDSVTRGSGR